MTRSNRLAGETSPYLLQHANNPVDWYPWGNEALERAVREDKPIFLSIGYAACHWCHVMEKESFESPAVAEFLKQHFVAIKVDREERPDLDDVYMAATVALSGSGGWPMSVFLTPEREPFFAGTYFPPDDRYGRPGFLTLLRKLVELWEKERAAVFEQAHELSELVKRRSETTASSPIDARSLDRAVLELSAGFDARYGGFSGAPKFPPHQTLGLLLRHYRRTGEARAREMLETTLDGMKNGGIYDHVAGGFARYSTDERWLVPHFEKMLYDNAQLVPAYLEAYQLWGNPEYGRVASETLDYVVREMQGPDGGYYSATDADSEGEEGKFFVFSREQIAEILSPDDADAFCLYYDVSPEGNWEGKNVLNTPRRLDDVAAELGTTSQALAARLAQAKEVVYRARAERVPPLLDDKVLTAWNGLMIGAMAEGHRVLGDERYLRSARAAADFARTRLARADGGLYRTTRAGKAHVLGFLEDYAYLADGLVTLYEASGERATLDEALRLAERLVRDFGEQGGAFFHTAADHEALIARTREGHDGALPNPNAVAARALVRLSHHLDRADLRERAAAALTDYGGLVGRAPRAFASTLCLVDFLLDGPTELVLVGVPGAPDTRALAEALARSYVPNRVFALVDPARGNDTPLARGKGLVGGRAALYVCRNYACLAPIARAEDVAAALDGDRAAREREPALDVP